MRFIPTTRTTLVAATLVAASTTSRLDAKSDPRIYDWKLKKVLGQTRAEWTAQWWQWVYSIPAPVNPILADSGAYVEVGQFGSMWFLGGTFTGASVTRTATIPTGKSLLIPLVNTQWDAFDPTATTVELMRSKAAEQVNQAGVASLSCVIDGVPLAGLEKGQVKSPVFEYHIPEDNVYQTLGYTYLAQPIHRGVVSPAVSDGYWVFLKPLPEGTHTVACTGGGQNFTYVLTVVDHDKP